MTDRESGSGGLPPAVLSGCLGTLLLERTPDGTLVRIGPEPAWSVGMVGERLADPSRAFPFLDSFLEDAHAVWEGTGDGCRRSGLWTQEGQGARTLYLSARAVRSGDRRLLIITDEEDGYRDHQMLAQRGRDSALALERLNKEIQKKEILVHCVVHDLAVPINTLTGSVGLLSEAGDRIPPDLARLVQSASRAAVRMSSLVREILDAFAAEQEELAHVETDPRRAPDALGAVRAALELIQPQARDHEVSLRVVVPDALQGRVVGESSRLERVFLNLLENAIRFSPPGGSVTVRVTPDGDYLRVAVEDEGPGVPAELQPQLFQRFVQGRGRMGRMGLGLYFCAMMMQRWGGAVSYSPAPGGGARFELRFSRPRFDAGLREPLIDARQ